MNELISNIIYAINLPEVQTVLSTIGTLNSFGDFLGKLREKNNTLGKEAIYCYVESYRRFCDAKGIVFRYDVRRLIEGLTKQYDVKALDTVRFNKLILDYLCNDGSSSIDYQLWEQIIDVTIAENGLTVLHTFLMQRSLRVVNCEYPRFLTELAPRPPMESQFVEREDECRRILDLINQEKKLVLVNGLGGVGKSTVCKELFYYLKEEKDIILAWVTYNGESLEGDFIKQFYYPETLRERENNLKYILETEMDETAIIFVDNLNVREIDDPFISVLQRANCCVVCTSRVTDYNYFTHVPIDFFETEKCIKLFKSYAEISLNDTSYDEAIKDIVMCVGKHTLTIEILAKIALAEQILPNELAEQLHEKGIDVEGIVDVELKENTLVGHLCRIFPVSNLNDEERYILAHFANCPLEQIPKNIIKWLGLKSRRSVNVLIKYGWFIENDNSFYMHPIITEVVKRICTLNSRDYDILIYNLDVMSCYDRNLGVAHVLPYYQYIRKVIEVNADKIDKSIAHLCFNLGVVDEQTKNYDRAIELFEMAIRMWSTMIEGGDENEIIYLNTRIANTNVQIGSCYYYMSTEGVADVTKRVEELRKELEYMVGVESVAMRSALKKEIAKLENDKKHYVHLYQLAREWYDKTNVLQGKYDDVELEKQLPNNYALTYKYEYEADPNNTSKNILYRSLELFYSTVVGFQKLHKVDEFMAVAYRNIGDLYYCMEKHNIAIFYYNKALIISRRQVSPYLPNLGKNYMQLGDTFMQIAISIELKSKVARLVKLKVAFGYYQKAHLIANENFRKGVNMVNLRRLEDQMLMCENEIIKLSNANI